MELREEHITFIINELVIPFSNCKPVATTFPTSITPIKALLQAGVLLILVVANYLMDPSTPVKSSLVNGIKDCITKWTSSCMKL